MRDLPILFGAEMVNAILEDRKTQTRRLVRIPTAVEKRGAPVIRTYCTGSGQYPGGNPNYTGDQSPALLVRCADNTCQKVPSPYGIPGDRLWVRETWCHTDWTPGDSGRRAGLDGFIAAYRADYAGRTFPAPWQPEWKPSIHMPRWASRITLEVTGIRVERLQAITTEDIQAEGLGDAYKAPEQMRAMWVHLWDGINGKRAPWADNPFVWVVSFKRIGAAV